VTTQNAPAVAEICARLDGIPLAIELAAARVRVLPPEQLLARLDDRFRLLTGGSRTALQRHQTLQATVDWSYDLLTEPEQALFAALGVFAGGWTLDAAEAVGPAIGIASQEVLELLTHLADKSLVTVDQQPDGTARFRLLETLRQYARQKLVARGATAPVRRHHAAFYLALVEASEPQLFGPETVRWRHRLGAEQDNLRTALDWCVAGQEVEQGLRLASGLAVALRPWQTFGSLSEWHAYFCTLFDLPAEGLPSAVRATAS
jgi:predicted ATPase